MWPRQRTSTSLPNSAFISRTGVSNGWIYLSPQFYPEWEGLPWLLRFSPEIVISQTYDLQREEQDFYFRLAGQMFTTRQGFLRVELSRSKEFWQNRAFWQNGFMVAGNVQLRNWLYFGGHLSAGEGIYYWNDPAYMGDTLSASLGVDLRFGSRLSQGFNIFHEKFNRQTTGAQIYEVNILRARTTWQMNRYFFLRGLVQYDSSRDRMLTDFLASFTWIPGTVLHLGYGSIYERQTFYPATDSWVYGHGDLTEIRRGIFFKASYNLRFGKR